MVREKAVSCLILLCLICCIVGIDSCGEWHCQVVVIEGDSASHFRSRATEEGVRLVHLDFTIPDELSNGNYEPLISKNRILPYRWAWARSLTEPMLSLSYDYDVLSLGLLNNQVRGMVVSLKENPSGCLQALNSSCQDIVIARALLDITRDENKSPNRRDDVVCVRVLQEYSFGIGGSFKYQCCGEDRQNNRSTIYCNQSVKESVWLALFNAILALVVGVVFLYWPIILCALPDFFDEEDGVFGQKIPVDDLSPVTVETIVRTFAKKLPTLNHGFNVKLIFLWYFVIPVFFYIKVVLYFIIKSSSFDDASRKLIFQVADFYLFVFNLNKPLVYVLFIVPFFVILGVIFPCWRPNTETVTKKECRLCGFEERLSLKKEIREHIQILPKMISNILECWLRFFLDRWRDCNEFWKNNYVRGQHSVFGHAISVLWSVTSVAIMGSTLVVVTILIYLLASIACIIIFCPYVCVMMITLRFIRKQVIFKGILLTALFYYSSLSVGIVAIFSCQFAVRLFGFVIMGVTLNAEFAVPYLTFVFVVGRNVYLCYSNLQNRYKEVKEMISEQWKEVTNEQGTIPRKLFRFVCNEKDVLPFANEIFVMLMNIVFIVIFLIVALAAILLFKMTYNSSAVVSSIAVFLSGRISEVFFTGVTAGQSFSGWEKLCKREMILSAIKHYRNLPEIPKSRDLVCVDLCPCCHVTNV